MQRVPLACSTLTAAELAEHGIPTLGEVLAAVGCDPFLDVELKEPVRGAIDALELERGGMADDGQAELRNAVVSSFEPRVLGWLRAHRPTWPRWLNAYDLAPATIEAATDLGCAAISVEWRTGSTRGRRARREPGLDVAAWTVREDADYERLAALGLVAICAEAAALDG